jgi:hypothetical protein
MVPQNVSSYPVNLSISLAGLLVVELPAVSDTRQHQPMADGASSVSISRQPCDGPDCARNEQEPIRVTKIPSRKKLRQKGSDS